MDMRVYSDVRGNIKTGDLLAWSKRRIKDPIDLLLVLYQKMFKAKYSHVALAINLGNRLFIIESTSPQVRLIPVSMVDDFYHIELGHIIHKRDVNVDKLFCNLGKQYSLLDFFSNLFKLKTNPDSYYCSEFTYDFYESLNIPLNEGAGLTPDTIVEEMLKVSGKEILLVKNDKKR